MATSDSTSVTVKSLSEIGEDIVSMLSSDETSGRGEDTGSTSGLSSENLSGYMSARSSEYLSARGDSPLSLNSTQSSSDETIQAFRDLLKNIDAYYNRKDAKKLYYEKNLIVSSLDCLKNKGDKKKKIFEIVQAGVMIMAHIAGLAGTLACGVNLSFIIPVCKIFLEIAGLLVSRSQKTDSVQRQIGIIIKKELADFKFEMLEEDIYEVMLEGELMANDLNHFISNSTVHLAFLETNSCAVEGGSVSNPKEGEIKDERSQENSVAVKVTLPPSSEIKVPATVYDGFSEISKYRLDKIYQCMGKLKYIAEKKFVALKEESTDPTYKDNHKNLTGRKLLRDDIDRQRESHAKQCLMCLAAYCDLASIYLMNLYQHKILSHGNNLATDLIDIRLDKIDSEAKSFLAFLSDRDMLAPIGWWEGKLRVMYEYRRTPNYYRPIKRFLSIIELPETSYTIEEASKALDMCLSLTADAVPKMKPSFSKNGVNTSFGKNNRLCLIVNNTRWPVCIFLHSEDTKVNKFEFKLEVSANCEDTVSMGAKHLAGIITVGEKEQPLSDMGYVQYIEFTLSKGKIYTKPVDSFPINTSSESHKDHLNKHDKAKSFTYDGQFCIVQGERKESKNILYTVFIEEFDHDKLQQRTINPFKSLMSSDDK